MTQENNNYYEKYYNYIVNTLGHVHIKVCKQLAKVVAKYESGIELRALYRVVAEEENTSVDAIARNIRSYIAGVMSDASLEDLSTLFGYTFHAYSKNVLPRELIPVLKFKIDEIDMQDL